MPLISAFNRLRDFLEAIRGIELLFHQKSPPCIKLMKCFRERILDVLQENRAGDENTKRFFRLRAEKTLVKVRQLENRLRTTNKLNSADEAKYYDSWIYSAVHMASRVPEYQDLKKLSLMFGTTSAQMSDILSTLATMGLVEFESGKVTSHTSGLHVGESSPWVSRHHMNWRHKTAEKLSRGNKDGLHYTSVISCSAEDLTRIREFFIDTIQKTRKTVSKSDDEVVAHYSLDLYQL
jgi:hypothetical protein